MTCPVIPPGRAALPPTKAAPHRKLLALLCLLLTVAGLTVVSLAVTADLALMPAEAAPAKVSPADAFGQIVPGMTRAEDLAALGFDAAHAQTLPTTVLAQRFAGSFDRAAKDCVSAHEFCTGYTFQSGPSASIVLLVMNGRVVHKVFDRA